MVRLWSWAWWVGSWGGAGRWSWGVIEAVLGQSWVTLMLDARVYVDVLGPLYVFPGPVLYSIHFYWVWDAQAEGMPWHLARPPISPVRYSLGMPWCPTRPPRVRVLVGVFGWYCCVNWCVTSLVWGSVRVAMAVCCAVQHATPHSTAQHPCALQHNATQV